jgi:hypothetical protein
MSDDVSTYRVKWGQATTTENQFTAAVTSFGYVAIFTRVNPGSTIWLRINPESTVHLVDSFRHAH